MRSCFFSVARQTQSGLGLLIVEVSRSHTGLVGFPCTSDKLVAEAATLHSTQQTQETVHPYPQRDSISRHQQSKGFRRTPKNVQPSGSAENIEVVGVFEKIRVLRVT